jgi:muramoyltetrapeptide carboxypeptidase LdcA involved in peptidoglycan recycling
MLEDINDKPERIDRFLARLTLAGYFDRCEGLLLGDFHEGDRTHDAAVLALLDYHLPALRELPVLVSTDLGHIWPVSPLPIHRQTIIEPIGDRRFVIHWSPSTLDVLGFDRADVLV